MTKNTQLNSLQNFPHYLCGTNTSHLKRFLNENNLTPTYFEYIDIPNYENDDIIFFNLYNKNKTLITQIKFNTQKGLFSL